MRGVTSMLILLLSAGLTIALLPGAAAADPDKALHLRGPAADLRDDAEARLEAADKLAHLKLPVQRDDGAHEPETVEEPNTEAPPVTTPDEPDLGRLHKLIARALSLMAL